MKSLSKRLIDFLRPHGFSRVWRDPMGVLWLVRQRDEVWSDVLSIQIYTSGGRFSSCFGIDLNPIRELVLVVAERISPGLLATNFARFVGLSDQPCLNIFRTPPGGDEESQYLFRREIDEDFLARVEVEFFSKVESELDYLRFLQRSDGVFEYVDPLRLIAIALLLRRLGHPSSVFREYVAGAQARGPRDHVLLQHGGLTADHFISKCIEIVWE